MLRLSSILLGLATCTTFLSLNSISNETNFIARQNASLTALPNQAILHGLMAHHSTSSVEMERTTHDTSWMLVKGSRLFTFLVGIPSSHQDLQEILTILEKHKPIALICDASLHQFFLKNGFVLQPRVDLMLPDTDELPMFACPSGHTIQPIINTTILKQFAWFGPSKPDEGFGYALINEEDIVVAEAYVLIGNQHGEICIATHPDYRDRGYATIVASQLIHACKDRKIEAHWSCACENKASLYVAFKVGFQVKCYYGFLLKH